jgi:iron complex transport system substrate-binding protein
MRRITAWCLSAALLLGGLSGCGTARQSTAQTQAAVSWSDMQPTDSVDLEYAECFSVDHYDGGYSLITVKDDARYLVVPENASVPDGLDADIVVLQQPLDSIYLVSSSVMDQFVALDALDSIALSGTKQDGWYIDEAKQAMADGKITYAGKYSAPDYELILNEGCDLAIESTMIHHNPEVQEKLEQFGIPVMVERSSYESHPLGRTEWMKLYAVLLGKEDVAEKVFKEQTDKLDNVLTADKTDKTVAFFYINSVGAVNVRKSGDYVSEMISLAGGNYVPEDTGESDNALSTMNMQMEEFYAKAKDADYIIYNSTIDGELQTIDELLSKSELLADFKAVKNGNVWCTGKNLFQETTGLGTMIEDIHTMLTTDDDSLDNLTYMHKLK